MRSVAVHDRAFGLWVAARPDVESFARTRRAENPLPNTRPIASVVTNWGQTHDISNGFVPDGSQCTTGAAEDPTLTIVALAIRQADHIAGETSVGTF